MDKADPAKGVGDIQRCEAVSVGNVDICIELDQQFRRLYLVALEDSTSYLTHHTDWLTSVAA